MDCPFFYGQRLDDADHHGRQIFATNLPNRMQDF